MKTPYAKYFITGMTAATVEYLFFVVMLHYGIWVLLANALSFGVGLTISFTLNRSWSFKSDQAYEKRGHHQLIMYATLAGFNLLVSSVVVGTLTHFGLIPLLAKGAAIAFVSSYNFFVFKLTIFKPATQPSPTSQDYAADQR